MRCTQTRHAAHRAAGGHAHAAAPARLSSSLHASRSSRIIRVCASPEDALDADAIAAQLQQLLDHDPEAAARLARVGDAAKRVAELQVSAAAASGPPAAGRWEAVV